MTSIASPCCSRTPMPLGARPPWGQTVHIAYRDRVDNKNSYPHLCTVCPHSGGERSSINYPHADALRLPHCFDEKPYEPPLRGNPQTIDPNPQHGITVSASYYDWKILEEELIAAGDEIRRAIGHYYQS